MGNKVGKVLKQFLFLLLKNQAYLQSQSLTVDFLTVVCCLRLYWLILYRFFAGLQVAVAFINGNATQNFSELLKK